MKYLDFFEINYRKNALSGSVFLLGIAAHCNSAAAPVSDLPQYVQDLLPANVTGYNIVGPGAAPYGTSGTISYLPDDRTVNGHSGMPGAIYVNGNSGSRPVIVVGDGVTVNTTADHADGLRSNGGTAAVPGYIIAGDRLTINVTGNDADGINAGYFTQYGFIPREGSNLIYVGDFLKITTEGNEGRGISAAVR